MRDKAFHPGGIAAQQGLTRAVVHGRAFAL